VCYLIDDTYLAAGDTVMNDLVCGNTMLPTGDAIAMYRSGQKLWRSVPASAFILGGHVSRPSGLDWEPYTPKSTVARASTRNMINRI
jgi:glyoxylase-like metal-dependent hydrolase (beta-lactamase superfamily II)